jgi:hypothetical protein
MSREATPYQYGDIFRDPDDNSVWMLVNEQEYEWWKMIPLTETDEGPINEIYSGRILPQYEFIDDE